jgi:hypothetical protein
VHRAVYFRYRKSTERTSLKSTKWSSSLEGSSCSDKQEIPFILWNQKNLYFLYSKDALTFPYCVPRKFTPQALIRFPQYQIYIRLLSVRRPAEWSHPTLVSDQNLLHTSVFSHVCRSPCEISDKWGRATAVASKNLIKFRSCTGQPMCV